MQKVQSANYQWPSMRSCLKPWLPFNISSFTSNKEFCIVGHCFWTLSLYDHAVQIMNNIESLFIVQHPEHSTVSESVSIVPTTVIVSSLTTLPFSLQNIFISMTSSSERAVSYIFSCAIQPGVSWPAFNPPPEIKKNSTRVKQPTKFSGQLFLDMKGEYFYKLSISKIKQNWQI